MTNGFAFVRVLMLSMLFSLVTCVASVAYGSPQPASSDAVDLTNPDVAAIVQLAKDFSEAYKAGDAKRLANTYSLDVIYMYQGMENHEGKDVIEQIFRDFFSQFTAEVVVHFEEVRVSGDMAFDRATFKVTSTPKAGGEPTVSEGRLLEVLRKEGGKWKSFRVMVNNDK